MLDRTPSAVDVTIGGEARSYQAFVTTAPAGLDRPSTVTLEESSFGRVAHFTADPIPFDATLEDKPARLVLIAEIDAKDQKVCYPKAGTWWHRPISFSSGGTRSSNGCGTGSRCPPIRSGTDGSRSATTQSDTSPAGLRAFKEVAP